MEERMEIKQERMEVKTGAETKTIQDKVDAFQEKMVRDKRR
jgi:hypothetical protein